MMILQLNISKFYVCVECFLNSIELLGNGFIFFIKLLVKLLIKFFIKLLVKRFDNNRFDILKIFFRQHIPIQYTYEYQWSITSNYIILLLHRPARQSPDDSSRMADGVQVNKTDNPPANALRSIAGRHI